MQLFFSPKCDDEQFVLSAEEARHALSVLRMRVGDTLHLTDGEGHLLEAQIVEASSKRCLLEKKSVRFFPPLPYSLTLCIAPTKNIDRFEWFLEKATEIGITRIIPIVTEHSERKILNIERERKVILSAVKQSLKMYVPHLEELTPLKNVLETLSVGQRFIAHCDSALRERLYLGDIIRPGSDTVILIGPEGDFSKEEIAQCVDAGYREISLGQQRFRTETAAVVATDIVSIINTLKR